MLVLIAGMIRSGSTLHFNMARLLLEHCEIHHEADYIATFEDIERRYAEFCKAREKGPDAPAALVVKTHNSDRRLNALISQDGVHGFYIYRNTLDMAASLARKTGRPIRDSWQQVVGALRAKYQFLDHPDLVISRYEDVIASYEIELMKMASALGLEVTPRELSALRKKLEPSAQKQHLKAAAFEKTPVATGSTWSMRREGEAGDDFVLVDPSTFLHKNHFTSDGGVGSWGDTLTAEEVSELAMLEEDISRGVSRATIAEMGGEINRLNALNDEAAQQAKEQADTLATMAAEVARLQDDVSDKEQALREQKDAAERLTAEVAALRDVVAERESALREQKEAAEELAAGMRMKEEELAEATSSLADSRRALGIAEDKLGALLEEQKRTQQNLARAENAVLVERSRATRLEQAFSRLEKDHQRIEQERAEQERRLAALSEAGARKDKALEAVPVLRKQLKHAREVASRERDLLRDQVCSVHAWRELMRAKPSAKILRGLPVPKVPSRLVWPADYPLTDQSDGVRISIVTPSYNSGADLERAILSVLEQDYPNWEHIVVDGGSTDNTISVLQKYDHVRWISEPDRGQVDAINKGFAMAQGDVVSYLNADDYYRPGAFGAVADCFRDEQVMVVYGDVEVYDEASDKWWLNRPCVDFKSVLHHWEPNAFCVNPVGYFFRREVQEAVPILESDGAKHDLAFLMGVAARYEGQSRKLDRVLGVFINAQDTQTGREQSVESYWSPENFSFIDRYLGNLPETEQKSFRKAQEAGYARRRQWLREAQREQEKQSAQA